MVSDRKNGTQYTSYMAEIPSLIIPPSPSTLLGLQVEHDGGSITALKMLCLKSTPNRVHHEARMAYHHAHTIGTITMP